MDDRSAKIIKVSPEIVARMIPEAFFHDLVVFFISIEKGPSDYVLAPKVIIPKIVKGNEAELT